MSGSYHIEEMYANDPGFYTAIAGNTMPDVNIFDEIFRELPVDGSDTQFNSSLLSPSNTAASNAPENSSVLLANIHGEMACLASQLHTLTEKVSSLTTKIDTTGARVEYMNKVLAAVIQRERAAMQDLDKLARKLMPEKEVLKIAGDPSSVVSSTAHPDQNLATMEEYSG